MKDFMKMDGLDPQERQKYRQAANKYCAVVYGIFAAACLALFVLSGASVACNIWERARIGLLDALAPIGFVLGMIAFAYAARTSWMTSKEWESYH